MAVQCVANAASQLINSSANISLPVQLPASLAQALGNGFTVNVWINSNWGTSAASRGRKSFVGIYGPTSVTQGLDAVYYGNNTFTPPAAFERLDSNIDLVTASGGPPGTSLAGNAINSIVWTGYWVPPTTGNYYFRVNVDDGLKLTVNGVVLLNVSAYGTYTSAAVATTAGVPLSFKVEYYNGGGAGAAQVSTSTTSGGTYTIIPASQFQTSATPAGATTALQIGTSTGSGEISCWTYGGNVLLQTANDYNNTANNSWINVCYTWDGLNHLLYINGALAATSTADQQPGILKYVTINGYWPGSAAETDNHYVDCYMLYGRTLSRDEIGTIYQAEGGRHGIWNGLIAQYEFDELAEGVSATTILDLSGSGASLLKVGTDADPKYSYSNTIADSNIRPPISP